MWQCGVSEMSCKNKVKITGKWSLTVGKHLQWSLDARANEMARNTTVKTRDDSAKFQYGQASPTWTRKQRTWWNNTRSATKTLLLSAHSRHILVVAPFTVAYPSSLVSWPAVHSPGFQTSRGFFLLLQFFYVFLFRGGGMVEICPIVW